MKNTKKTTAACKHTTEIFKVVGEKDKYCE